MDNKNILVITPFFAPETHAAVFRAHKLVKYLKREGWNPIVLTVDINYIYNENRKLLEELEGVEIVRAKYIEPTVRGLKMWLTGKDLTYKTLKSKGFYDSSADSNSSSDKAVQNKKSIITKLYKYLLDYHLNSPDRFWTWKKSAIKEAKKMIKQHNIRYLYTSSSPYTTLEIGTAIKSYFPHIKWIADYRDPLTYTLRNHSNIFSVFKLQKKIEIKALNIADAMIGAASSHNLIYHDLYSGKYDHKTHFIATGLDDDLLPESGGQFSDEIIYVGEYLINYGTAFFDYYNSFQEKYPELKGKLKIVFIGPKDINRIALQRLNLKNQVSENILLEDQIPQVELYKRLAKAKAVILCPGYESHWWTSFAKMVDYIALQKHVLAIVPNPSEARKQLSKAGVGLFLDSEKEAVDFFYQLANNELLDQNIDEQFCKNYLASTQVKSFIRIFERL